MFSVEAFENSLYEETGDPGGGGGGISNGSEVWEWSTAAVNRKPFGVSGILPETTGATYTDVMYPWIIANASEQIQPANVFSTQQPPTQPLGAPLGAPSGGSLGAPLGAPLGASTSAAQNQSVPNSEMLIDVPLGSGTNMQSNKTVGATPHSLAQFCDSELMQLSDVGDLPQGNLDGAQQQQMRIMSSPMLPTRSLATVKKMGYKGNCSTKRGGNGGGGATSIRKSNLASASAAPLHWSAVCACGSSSTAGCICGHTNGAMDYYGCGNSMCESRNSPILEPVTGVGPGGSGSSSSGTTSLSRFTHPDENGKRKIRNDIMSIAESLPSLPGLYFDKKQKGFRVRYQNVYVGWVALSRFPSIEEAYCSARDIWENAKAHAEKFQTPQAAIIASLPLQKQAKASGKNRGGRPRTVTQLPSEWGPGSNNGGGQNGQGSGGSAYSDPNLNPPQIGSRRMTSWSNNNAQLIANSMTGELTAAPSPTDHWSHQQISSVDMMYPTSAKFNELAIFAGNGGNPAGLAESSEPAGYYLPSPISYGKPVVTDDLNFDSTPWS